MLSSASWGMAAIGGTLSKVRPWPAWGSMPFLRGERGGVGDAAQLGGARLALEMGVAAGVELDDRRAEPDRRLDLARVGLDEQADPDVRRRARRATIRSEMIVLAGGVEPALGGPLLALLGDDAGGVGAVARARSSSISSVAAISRLSGISRLRHQRGDILVGDVAPVLAQMGGDAVGAGRRRGEGGADRIGMIAAARVPDRRDMVDVDAEAEVPASRRLAAPGLFGGDGGELGRQRRRPHRPGRRGGSAGRRARRDRPAPPERSTRAAAAITSPPASRDRRDRLARARGRW